MIVPYRVLIQKRVIIDDTKRYIEQQHGVEFAEQKPSHLWRQRALSFHDWKH